MAAPTSNPCGTNPGQPEGLARRKMIDYAANDMRKLESREFIIQIPRTRSLNCVDPRGECLRRADPLCHNKSPVPDGITRLRVFSRHLSLCRLQSERDGGTRMFHLSITREMERLYYGARQTIHRYVPRSWPQVCRVD